MVEFQIEWTPQNLLSIKGHGPTPLDLKLGANPKDTNDAGDVTLWMKMKLRNETRIAPSLGFRFGVQLPNSDRKSTRLNSSHRCISYAVFCLKKKKKTK